MATAQLKAEFEPRVQYAALPFRVVGADVDVLLVTSRETRRWIVPKGWPIRGLSGAEAAAREAYEEAGVIGDIAEQALGCFSYQKVMSERRQVRCDVALYALQVTRELEAWPEAAQRERRWMPWREAVNSVREDHLRELIIHFATSRSRR